MHSIQPNRKYDSIPVYIFGVVSEIMLMQRDGEMDEQTDTVLLKRQSNNICT